MSRNDVFLFRSSIAPSKQAVTTTWSNPYVSLSLMKPGISIAQVVSPCDSAMLYPTARNTIPKSMSTIMKMCSPLAWI